MTDHRIYSTPMTGVAEGGHGAAVEHEILDTVRATRTADGYFATLCGVRVSPTPCASPIGRACLTCRELLREAHERENTAQHVFVEVPEQSRGLARHRRQRPRRGRLADLLGHSPRDAR